MSTTQANKNDTTERRADVPGAYFGRDGNGNEHYYQSATRKMTVVTDEATKTYGIDYDQDLIDWAIATVEETGAYWAEVRVEEPKNKWLTGELPVGEFEEADA